MDVSNNIELGSDDWPIDPDGDSAAGLHFSSVYRFRLQYPFGKPKRLAIELFIMVNMAQLMYTGMLAFAKSAMLSSQGTSATLLCFYRVCALFLIELSSKLFFESADTSEEMKPEHHQYATPAY